MVFRENHVMDLPDLLCSKQGTVIKQPVLRKVKIRLRLVILRQTESLADLNELRITIGICLRDLATFC